MELVLSSILEKLQHQPNSTISTICFIIISILCVLRFTRRNNKFNNLPPYPPKLPLIGNLHQLGTLPHQSLKALSDKYGPLLLLQLGQTQALVVSSSDIVEEIVKTHDVAFSNRANTKAAKVFFYQCKDIGFAPYGEEWRNKRKLCVLELLSTNRVKSFQPIRENEVSIMINSIHEACAKGSLVNLSKMIVATSMNISSRCIFGLRFETSDDGRKSIVEAVRKMMTQLSKLGVGDLFPSLDWIDVLTGFTSRLKVTHAELDAFLEEIIEEHKRKKKNCDDNNKDFVDVLLQLQERDMLEFELNGDTMKALLLDMFVAGSDTVSSTIEWVFAELANNPKTMKKVQEEVRRIVGGKSMIEENDINQMKYMKCVIKETLRLHPPGPFLIPRETANSVEILIPKNTSLLIRRVPGRPRLPIVTELEQKKVDFTAMEAEPENSSLPAEDASAPEDSDWDEFGNDLYEIPDVPSIQSSNLIPEAPPTNKADEESKIKALIDTPALDWQRQGSDFGAGRGFGRGMGGRMGGGRGFGLERKTPPQGYVCHRCKVPGHFIQHCPTNGDPNYDIKRVKQPTGIPRSMLMVNPQGSYALPNGSVAVLKPNEAAFEKEIEGLPSTTRSVGDLPPELHCPLCNDVMKDAVLTSKCCFKSFCDKCIRDYIISKSMCICGATNILADDLLPNKTLRDTINRILESGNSSAENAGSTFQVQDMESARCPQLKLPSPTSSAASKGEPKVSLVHEGMTNVPETVDAKKTVSAPAPLQTSEQVKPRMPDVSEATHESMSVKEPASQGSAQLVEEEVQQKMVPAEAGKKKKRKKVHLPANDFQWKTPHDLGAESYMMPMGPAPGYNSYWNGMQPCMEGFMGPYGGPMQMMGYGLGPLDMPFAGGLPHDPFGMQGYMMPVVPPHRDLAAEYGMGMHVPPPVMSREEFEARKADRWRKRENEKRIDRDFSKDRDVGKEASSIGDVPMKSKTKSLPAPPSSEYHHPQPHRYRAERVSPDRSPREVEPPRPIKRKADYHVERERERERECERDHDHDRDQRDHRDRERGHHHHRHHRSESSSRMSSEPVTKTSSTAPSSAAAAADRKQKASVFSRISFPAEEEMAKKRKISAFPTTEAASAGPPATSSAHLKAAPKGYHEGRKSSTISEYESSDDERHFKRRPSRHKLST